MFTLLGGQRKYHFKSQLQPPPPVHAVFVFRVMPASEDCRLSQEFGSEKRDRTVGGGGGKAD